MGLIGSTGKNSSNSVKTDVIIKKTALVTLKMFYKYFILDKVFVPFFSSSGQECMEHSIFN